MTMNLFSATRVEAGVYILPAKLGDAPAILDLVSAVNLPQDGIEETLDYFWVAQERDTIRGDATWFAFSVNLSPDQGGVDGSEMRECFLETCQLMLKHAIGFSNAAGIASARQGFEVERGLECPVRTEITYRSLE